MIQLELSEADLESEAAQIDHNILPSGRYALTRDIKKALDGESFKYFEATGGKQIETVGIDKFSYNRYFQVFNDFKLFGLPNGRGSMNELPWVIDLIRFMTGVLSIVENWQANKTHGQSSISTREAGL